jgi:hypothetical protein
MNTAVKDAPVGATPVNIFGEKNTHSLKNASLRLIFSIAAPLVVRASDTVQLYTMQKSYYKYFIGMNSKPISVGSNPLRVK